MDKLLALKMFVETVDANGFSAAARKLGLATSTVTRMVDSLEAELGTALVNRSTRQITVTDAGGAYYLRARRILEDLADADAAIGDNAEEASGPLRISVPSAFGRCIISPHLGMFMSTYPKLELDITLTDSILDMVTDRVDLSIRLGSPAILDGVVCRIIGRFRRKVVCSPDYLQHHGFPESVDDLARHQCLRFNYGPSNQTWCFVDRSDAVSKITATGRFKSNNAEVLRDLALAGGGIALLPDWIVQDDILAGKLTPLFENYVVNPDSASDSISALFLPNQRGSRRVNAFISFLSDVLNDGTGYPTG
jgi:DNA-binding transcriptional LysR family regulator